MIRLPATQAAITAPLVASNTSFPGVPIGRSETDGRPFRLSPVLVDHRELPATNSLALGGLGSGKSTTDKVWLRREILHHNHQAVVIDSFGEDTAAGEWAALTRSLGGLVVEAGTFTLNPCSLEFGTEVREQLIRSLIAAAEPAALTLQSAHALQHALNSPKADRLGGLVDALVNPEDGRWPAEQLAAWGVDVAIALSRYTEGSLRGLFDGPDASLPPTDLPIVSFDFSSLDRNSPAIPALMAAITCWVEQVWLRQSTAVHRHLVLEEAWQILLSPATAELIQRLLKNSRKAALSLKVIMHTLSDLGDGRAQDLAKLCEIAHVGRLGPEEAAIVGAILGLPAWAIKKIPTLAPGQAVWKVGPDFVDVIQTIINEDEARLTDTSTRRRKAQQVLAADDEEAAVTLDKEAVPEEVYEYEEYEEPTTDDGLDFDLPPNVIDTLYTAPQLDYRHHAVLQAAGEGRFNEASDLAALGEREDITAHGINSPQAKAWLITRAEVAELSGNRDQAAQLRATVARMGNNDGAAWWEQTNDIAAQGHPAPPEPEPEPAAGDQPRPGARRRRTGLYVAAIATLALASAVVWQKSDDDDKRQQQQEQAAAYKGVSATDLNIDGVKTETLASWSKDGRSVILSAWVDSDENAKFVRIDSGDQTAKEVVQPLKEGQAPMPIRLEVKVPVTDHYQAVRLTVAVGGSTWKEGIRPPHRTIEYRPDRTAIDAETGKPLKQAYSHL
ncbi:hypothetical protein L0F81_39940 [Streptomyces tricolor]|uniref:ATP/GTP-binding protein n=1 Tax=Streptomyces tricolor TaxID=68277 RepID=A0ABS9JUY0_9ACTN|nr:hypothetical protein [Streptomyces tricolor]MCG0069367.1 hypothetical protein [Streptomyces tricolor]